MAYKVIRSDSFERAYDSALEHLAKTLHSPQAASHLLQEMQRVADTLAATPYIKAVSSKPFLKRQQLREYFIMKYAVIYVVENDTVTLINLFHQSQDYEAPYHWE